MLVKPIVKIRDEVLEPAPFRLMMIDVSEQPIDEIAVVEDLAAKPFELLGL